MRRFDPFLVSLLCVFALLAMTTLILVPLFEGPDEDDHFRFAKTLADQRALPVQLFQEGGGAAGHQGWQPPLYYGLAALVIAPIDTGDFEKRLQRNPAAALTGDLACCGRNNYFHLDAENFPYKRTTLAVHLARGVTILFGLLAVFAIYTLVLTLFPAQRYLALAVTAVATLNPSFLYSSALVSNDVPLAALCAVALLVMAKIVMRQWAANWKAFAVLGVVVSLALLTKTTALGLLPLVFLMMVFLAYRARSIPNFFLFAFSFGIPLLLLTGWWFVRNQMLYGDPLAYKLIAASALPPRDAPLTFAELTQINLPWLWQTFWGGPTPGDFPQLLLVLLLGAFLLAGIGVVYYVRGERRILGADRLVMLGLLLLWLVFIFVAQIQFIRTASGTDQGRYLFPAISTIALIYVLGWSEIVWRIRRRAQKTFEAARAQRIVAIVMAAFCVALPAFVLVTYTLPAYAQPALIDPTTISRHASVTNSVFENGMQLGGYALDTSELSCNQKLVVTLFWSIEKRTGDTYRVFAHLVNGEGTVAGNKDVIPGGGAYPTVYWKPGQWFQDKIEVPLNHGARAGKYNVIVGVYKFGDPNDRLNLQNSEDDFVSVGTVQVNAPAEGCP